MSCKDHYLTAGAKTGANTLQTTWTFSEMQKDSRQRGLPTLADASARNHSLHKEMDAPDPATVKFPPLSHLCNHGKIVEKPTADSANTFTKWVSARFTRITGTLIDEDRSEVYIK